MFFCIEHSSRICSWPRFIHYVLPKKSNVLLDVSDELGYDSDDDSDREEDLNDIDLMNEKIPKINHVIQRFTQILIIAHMLGKKDFILSRYGTKKFLTKVRQFQELSQLDKMNDIDYSSRMGKCAEILCKLAALAQILNISIKILKSDWNDQQDQEHRFAIMSMILSRIYREQFPTLIDDVGASFIRNVTPIIAMISPIANSHESIQASSCLLAGRLMCNHLIKMLFCLYDTETKPNEDGNMKMHRSISDYNRCFTQHYISIKF